MLRLRPELPRTPVRSLAAQCWRAEAAAPWPRFVTEWISFRWRSRGSETTRAGRSQQARNGWRFVPSCPAPGTSPVCWPVSLRRQPELGDLGDGGSRALSSADHSWCSNGLRRRQRAVDRRGGHRCGTHGGRVLSLGARPAARRADAGPALRGRCRRCRRSRGDPPATSRIPAGPVPGMAASPAVRSTSSWSTARRDQDRRPHRPRRRRLDTVDRHGSCGCSMHTGQTKNGASCAGRSTSGSRPPLEETDPAGVRHPHRRPVRRIGVLSSFGLGTP